VGVHLGMLRERDGDCLEQDVVHRHLELVAQLGHRAAHLHDAGEIQLGGEVRGWTDSSWFGRLDWNYKSGVWSNQANIVRTQDRHVFNARAGITRGIFSIEERQVSNCQK